MKRFLSLLAIALATNIFLGSPNANAMEVTLSKINTPPEICALAASIIDSPGDFTAHNIAKLGFTNSDRKILYYTILTQAQQRWPDADWLCPVETYTLAPFHDESDGIHTPYIPRIILGQNEQLFPRDSRDEVVKTYSQDGAFPAPLPEANFSPDGQFFCGGSMGNTFNIYRFRFGKFEDGSLEKLLAFINTLPTPLE